MARIAAAFFLTNKEVNKGKNEMWQACSTDKVWPAAFTAERLMTELLVSGKGFLSASKRLREAVEERGPEYPEEDSESEIIKKFKLRITELPAAPKQHTDLKNHSLRRYFKEAERVHLVSYKKIEM